jgi:hypothetical protein
MGSPCAITARPPPVPRHGALGVAAPEADRPGILAELARLHADELGNPYEPIDALERLIGGAPSDAAALRRLAGLDETVGR